MDSRKTELTKEKTVMPDGRYLIYYSFQPDSERDTNPEQEKGQINQTKEDKHV